MRYRTAYFCGNARTPMTMANISNSNNLILGLLIDLETGVIIDVSVTLITTLAKDVVKSYLVGRNVIEEYDAIVEEISFRHVGDATRPMLKALADIRRNYLHYMEINGPYLRGETDIRPEF